MVTLEKDQRASSDPESKGNASDYPPASDGCLASLPSPSLGESRCLISSHP